MASWAQGVRVRLGNMGVWRMAERGTPPTRETLTDSSGKRPSLGVWAGKLAGAGPPSGSHSPRDGAVPLDAQEPCLQLCQCDLRVTALPASARGPEATQRRQGRGKSGDGERHRALHTRIGGRGAPGGAHAACPSCLSESRGPAGQKGH